MARRSSPPPRSPLLRRIVLSMIVAVAVGALVYVATEPAGDDEAPLPSAVEAVSPEPGAQNLRQTTIAADLAVGFTGYLLMDGVEVPRDDLQVVDALGQVILRPTEDSDYRVLAPGPHCATVVYRKIGDRLDQSSSYRWCFSVH
ncbi:MAG TPA: hypothetical protein VG455_06800 [Acidimicrobiales bacterium]|nr:hypothetical protein [Acidimicrobiales bacterium]